MLETGGGEIGRLGTVGSSDMGGGIGRAAVGVAVGLFGGVAIGAGCTAVDAANAGGPEGVILAGASCVVTSSEVMITS